MPTMPHAVQFYQDDVFLIESVSAFIKSGLEEGATVIILATEHHRKELQRSLDQADPPLLATQVMFFDATAMLSTIMRDNWPSKMLFMREVGHMVQRAALKGPVRIFGELVAVLWAQGDGRAAIRLEELWNELAKEHTFSLLCAYPTWAFSDQKDADSLRQICQTHTHVHTCSHGPHPNMP